MFGYGHGDVTVVARRQPGSDDIVFDFTTGEGENRGTIPATLRDVRWQLAQVEADLADVTGLTISAERYREEEAERTRAGIPSLQQRFSRLNELESMMLAAQQVLLLRERFADSLDRRIHTVEM